MVSWDYFKTIRRLNIPVWLKNCGIESHDDLVKVLGALGVSPPEISVTVDWFKKPKASPKVTVAKKAVVKPVEKVPVDTEEPPKPKRKPRRRKDSEEETSVKKEELDGES